MKKWLPILIIAFFLLLPVAGIAQGCSVCTKTATQLGEKGAKGLNGGIVYLAAVPLAILGTIGFIFYRHQRA
jgi:hypothetical protein